MLFTFQKSEPQIFFFWFEIGEIEKGVHKIMYKIIYL